MAKPSPSPRILALSGLCVILASLGFLIVSSHRPEGSKPAAIPGTGSLSGRPITVLTNPPHIRAADALARWFQAETGAVVRNRVVNYEQMLAFTLADLASDQPELDVVMLWYVDLGALVSHGALADLSDFIAKHREILKPEDYLPSLYDPYTRYQGRQWALPYDGDSHLLFYRPSILEKHGLKPPETWADYSRVARIITQKERENGIYGTALMAPDNPMIIVSSFMNRLAGFGGRLVDEKQRPCVNRPAAVAALRLMLEHARYALPSPLETDWEVSRDAFLTGRVAMAEQWTDIGVMAEDPSQSLIQGDWAAVQMPRAQGETGRHSPALNAGFSLGISAKSRDPEAARAYLLFASRPDIRLKLNLINGGIDPTRISVLESRAYQDFAPRISRAARAALSRATPWPRLPQTPRLLEVLTRNLILALETQKSPQQALDDTQAGWEAILANGQ